MEPDEYHGGHQHGEAYESPEASQSDGEDHHDAQPDQHGARARSSSPSPQERRRRHESQINSDDPYGAVEALNLIRKYYFPLAPYSSSFLLLLLAQRRYSVHITTNFATLAVSSHALGRAI